LEPHKREVVGLLIRLFLRLARLSWVSLHPFVIARATAKRSPSFALRFEV
jgi:hypothetical protein